MFVILESLLVLIKNFDLILEMYWILPWKCWCICLLAGHDMGDPFEVSTLRREVIIYYLTICIC